MWRDFDKNIDPMRKHTGNSGRKLYRLANVVPPIISVQFAAINNIARHRRIKRYGGFTGLDCGERLFDRQLDTIHCRAVKRVINIQPFKRHA